MGCWLWTNESTCGCYSCQCHSQCIYIAVSFAYIVIIEDLSEKAKMSFNGISKGPNRISEATSSMLRISLHCLIFLYNVRFIPQPAKKKCCENTYILSTYTVELFISDRHRSGPWLEHKERQIIRGVKKPPLQIVQNLYWYENMGLKQTLWISTCWEICK